MICGKCADKQHIGGAVPLHSPMAKSLRTCAKQINNLKGKIMPAFLFGGLPHNSLSSYDNNKPLLRGGFLWYFHFMSAPNPKIAHTDGT